MTEEELRKEVERCHTALARIYEQLVALEPTLSLEQVLLCPVDECKYWKHPEWEERYEYLQTSEGRQAADTSLAARKERLKAWFEQREEK